MDDKKYKTYAATCEFEKNSIWTQLYVSQSYGTLFGLYGCIETKKTDGVHTLKRIQLELLNFKGTLDLAIDEDSTKVRVLQKHIIIELGVCALGTPYKCKKGFHRHLTEDSMVLVRKTLVPMNKTKGNERVFDTEFAYRDSTNSITYDLKYAGKYLDYKQAKWRVDPDERRILEGWPGTVISAANADLGPRAAGTPACPTGTRFIRLW